MMVFDRFPARSNADSFAVAVQEQTGEQSIVCDNRDEFAKHEAFPYELKFPVVLVPRLDDIKAEEALELLVVEFDGEFAGT